MVSRWIFKGSGFKGDWEFGIWAFRVPSAVLVAGFPGFLCCKGCCFLGMTGCQPTVASPLGFHWSAVGASHLVISKPQGADH